MTLEMPEIDSKGQSAHLCFYLLNVFYFPVLLFYSVDACPPQRTYVVEMAAMSRIANRNLNKILTRFVLTIFVKEMSEIVAMIAEKMHFISIEGVSTFRAKHSLRNVRTSVVLL
jgi:hypothetical protein